MNDALQSGLVSAATSRGLAPAPGTDSQMQLGITWLMKLRWGAVVGQLLALGVAKLLFGLDLPYGLLLGLVACTGVSNALLSLLELPVRSTWRLLAAVILDVVLLTAMLAASGGASNPFTVFFLVHVALASLVLEAKLAWAVLALTAASFGALFFLPGEGVHGHDHGPWSAHLVGMWIAYVLAAGFVTYFVGRVSRAIFERDHKLADIAAQNERLATLSSFSANAAHELGSPLATIGLAAKELAIGLRQLSPPSPLIADADLACREVGRCREILADISARAGESVGEMPMQATAELVIDELMRRLPPALASHLSVSYVKDNTARAELVAPIKTLAQMLSNLVRNAFDAQEEAEVMAPVELQIDVGERLCFRVLDRGSGLKPELQARIGEPFISTKAERGGLGLGVYLARSYATRTGGCLSLSARDGGGTRVELCLPRNCLGRFA